MKEIFDPMVLLTALGVLVAAIGVFVTYLQYDKTAAKSPKIDPQIIQLDYQSSITNLAHPGMGLTGSLTQIGQQINHNYGLTESQLQDLIKNVIKTLPNENEASQKLEKYIRLASEYKELAEKNLAGNKLAQEAQEAVTGGRLDEALALYDQSEAAWAELGEQAKAFQAEEYFEAAKILEFQCKYPPALLKIQAALQLAPNRWEFNNLWGVLLVDTVDYQGAIQAFQTAQTQLPNPQGVEAASLFNNLGNAWSELGEYAKAIEFYDQALPIFKKALGPEHVSVAQTYNNLGTAWSDLGEYAKAIEFYDQALPIYKKALGPEHVYVASTYNNLGLALAARGEYSKAIEFYDQALPIYKKALGPEHVYVAQTYNNLGTAWSDLGEYAKAIEFYDQALSIFKKALGPEHVYLAKTYNNLGLAWEARGEYAKAIEFYDQALSIYKKALGLDHPDIAGTSLNLALAYEAQSERQKALVYAQQGMAIFEKNFAQLNPNHPDLLKARRVLAHIEGSTL